MGHRWNMRLSTEICTVIAIHSCVDFVCLSYLSFCQVAFFVWIQLARACRLSRKTHKTRCAGCCLPKKEGHHRWHGRDLRLNVCVHRFSVVKNGMESLGPTAKHLHSLPCGFQICSGPKTSDWNTKNRSQIYGPKLGIQPWLEPCFPIQLFSHLAQLWHTATAQPTAIQAVAGRIKSLEEEQRELVEYQQLESSRPVFLNLSGWVVTVWSTLKNCGSRNGRPPFWFLLWLWYMEGMIMNQCTGWFVVKCDPPICARTQVRFESNQRTTTPSLESCKDCKDMMICIKAQGWWIWTANSIHKWHLLEAPRTKEAPKESSRASHWCLNGFCQEAAPLLRVRVDRPGLADSAGGKASKVTIQVARSSVLPSLAVNLHNICQISL